MQFSSFVALVGCCVELVVAEAKGWLVLLLLCAVVVSILSQTVHYTRIGLVASGSGEMLNLGWRDALYSSVVTFTTLGYGDIAPREEYRLVAAFQALYAYLFLGVLVGTVVAAFNRR